MNVSEALKHRKSVRAFLDKEVEKEKIDFILDHARYTPSGVNMQPWHVAVVSGKSKQNLQERLVKTFEAETPSQLEYQYYPSQWFEPFKSRRMQTGLLMFDTLGIARSNKEARIAQWKLNYRAFDAPVVLYIFMHKDLATGSFIDMGMFMQSIMLLSAEVALSTCPQAALAEYPDVVRSELGISDDLQLLGGIALGYEDTEAKINSYRTPRIEKEDFSSFYM
jgi:nitroreductase